MAEIVVKLVNGELAGKTAQQLTKEINAAAQAAKKAEVGTQQWIDAHARLDKAKQMQADLTQQINSTKAASDKLKAAWNMLPGAQFFNQIGQSFGMMKSGVGGLVSSFGVLRTAIAATGLGLLLIVLGSLYNYLTSVQSGIDKVTSVTRPLQAIFQRLIGVVQVLGERVFKQLWEAIQNPKQAMIELGNIIKDNLIKRFEALALFGPALKKIFSGDISGGFKDLGNASLQLATGVENVIDKVQQAGQAIAEWAEEGWNAGKRIDELTKAIERQEIANIRRTARLKAEIKELNFIVEDETATLKEREAAAESAMQKQQEMLQLQVDLIDMRVAKMKEEQALNDTSREQEKELAELEAQRFELMESITEAYTTMRNKLNMIHKRALDEEKKARMAHEAELRTIDDLNLSAREDSREKDLEALKVSLQRQIEALDMNSTLYSAHLAAITNAGRAQRAQINAEWDEKDRKAAEEAAQKELEIRRGAYEQDQVDLLMRLADREISRKQFDELARQNQIQFLDDQMAILQERGMQETEMYRQLQEEKVQIELDAQARVRDARKATFDAVMELGNSMFDSEIARINRQNEASERRLEAIKKQHGEESNSFKIAQAQIEAERKKNGERIKKFERNKVKINLLAELANIWMNANSFPFPYSVLIGGILSGAAIIRANQNIAGINQQQYEQGGLLVGPRHSQGGIPIEAEGGEFIFSRKAVQGIGVNRLQQVNDFYTRKFETGGPVNPFSTTSTSPSTAPSSTMGAGVDLAGQQGAVISEKLDQVIVELRMWPRRLKVVNNVTETEEALNTINEIRDAADV